MTITSITTSRHSNPMIRIPASVKRYWLAMNASAIQSAAHAGKTWLATAAAHTLSGDTVPALGLMQFGSILLFAFGLAILNWLDAHPLSQLLPPSPQTDEHRTS